MGGRVSAGTRWSGQRIGTSKGDSLTSLTKLLRHRNLGSCLTASVKLERPNWTEFWLWMRKTKIPTQLLSRALNCPVLRDIWWKCQAIQNFKLSDKVLYIIWGSIYCNVAIYLQGKKQVSFFTCQSLWELAPTGRLNKYPDKLMWHRSKQITDGCASFSKFNSVSEKIPMSFRIQRTLGRSVRTEGFCWESLNRR